MKTGMYRATEEDSMLFQTFVKTFEMLEELEGQVANLIEYSPEELSEEVNTYGQPLHPAKLMAMEVNAFRASMVKKFRNLMTSQERDTLQRQYEDFMD
jgi:hypothetical protein